jgi:hypothetical protein
LFLSLEEDIIAIQEKLGIDDRAKTQAGAKAVADAQDDICVF